MDAGVAPILASTQINYKRPVGLYDEPVGHMWCTHLGRASIWLEAEITVGDQVCAHAIQRGSFLVLATSKASRTPEELMAHFEAGNK
jgi:acyl-CoA thioester hydrolase